jgi:hypothetical protein
MVSLLVLASSPGVARAQDKVACASAYEGAQLERRQGHLRASRQQLLVCSQPACTVLQKECVNWLSEVEAALPSVVVEATGPDGRDTVDVEVTCDGAPLVSRLDGRALPMDPGMHRCRFETAGAVREDQIVLHEGEQGRPWRVSFAPPEGATPAPLAPAPGPSEASPIPVWAWVLGGLGVAAVGVGAGFEVHGFTQKSDLDACKGSCQQSAVDATHASFVTGDVTIGAGLAVIAIATVFVLVRPHGVPSDAWILLPPSAGTAGALLGGRF